MNDTNQQLKKEDSVLKRIFSWFKDKCPFFITVKNLNEDDPDAPDKPAVVAGIKISF